jgi:hypothetical protein
MGKRKRRSTTKEPTAPLPYEATLWAAADALRNNMDAAEYKHVVLGLVFLKYISDAFAARHAELEAERAQGADPEDPDEYRAASIFWVPGNRGARESRCHANSQHLCHLTAAALSRLVAEGAVDADGEILGIYRSSPSTSSRGSCSSAALELQSRSPLRLPMASASAPAECGIDAGLRFDRSRSRRGRS